LATYRSRALPVVSSSPLFLLTATAPPNLYTLSLHDALPIFCTPPFALFVMVTVTPGRAPPVSSVMTPPMLAPVPCASATPGDAIDRKSTRLNSSHQIISYAVFCLKKKKQSTSIH